MADDHTSPLTTSWIDEFLPFQEEYQFSDNHADDSGLFKDYSSNDLGWPAWMDEASISGPVQLAPTSPKPPRFQHDRAQIIGEPMDGIETYTHDNLWQPLSIPEQNMVRPTQMGFITEEKVAVEGEGLPGDSFETLPVSQQWPHHALPFSFEPTAKHVASYHVVGEPEVALRQESRDACDGQDDAEDVFTSEPGLSADTGAPSSTTMIQTPNSRSRTVPQWSRSIPEHSARPQDQGVRAAPLPLRDTHAAVQQAVSSHGPQQVVWVQQRHWQAFEQPQHRAAQMRPTKRRLPQHAAPIKCPVHTGAPGSIAIGPSRATAPLPGICRAFTDTRALPVMSVAILSTAETSEIATKPNNMARRQALSGARYAASQSESGVSTTISGAKRVFKCKARPMHL